jgi:hypothetical protein
MMSGHMRSQRTCQRDENEDVEDDSRRPDARPLRKLCGYVMDSDAWFVHGKSRNFDAVESHTYLSGGRRRRWLGSSRRLGLLGLARIQTHGFAYFLYFEQMKC